MRTKKNITGQLGLILAVFTVCIPVNRPAAFGHDIHNTYDARPMNIRQNYRGPGGPAAPVAPQQKRPTPPPGAAPDYTKAGVTPADIALIEAVKKFGAPSANGQLSPLVCKYAEQHSDWMARTGQLTHEGGNRGRFRAVMAKGGRGSGEIIAYNFGPTAQAAARSCVKQWYNSSGHRKQMMSRQAKYCYTMKKARGNKWYCEGLFVK